MNLDKNFIPYDLNLELLEKNFDITDPYEGLHGFYYKRRSSGEIFPLDYFHIETNANIQQYERIQNDNDLSDAAPLWQDITSWLRNKHKIYLSAPEKIDFIDGTVSYHWKIRGQEVKYNKYSSYNEALYYGIKEAIKLIKL